MLLPGSRVVAAFHHVSAILLLDPEIDTIDLDVLVLGDDREATDLVQALAARIPGVRGIYAGRLRNCGQIEALTANLVSINRRYKAHAGLRITDILKTPFIPERAAVPALATCEPLEEARGIASGHPRG